MVIYTSKQKEGELMQGFTTTVQLPDEINRAIVDAVNAAFTSAAKQQANGAKYPPYMNLKQAASYLGVSFNTVKKWVKMYPDFPVAVINGSYHINREELDKFMLSMQNK